MYPTASAVDTLANSPTAFENPITLAAGLRSYLAGTTNRWGDYSGAARDPSNPAHVWVTAEYQASASDAGNWGTATGEIAIQPFVSTVSPNAGPVGGGQPVTIAGRNFQPGAAVSFGPNPATNVVVVSSIQITATTPAGNALGPVNVTVSQPDGSAVTATGAYTYTVTVTSLVPNHGSPAGGTSMAVIGTSFIAVTAVTFGSTAATAYTVDSATHITATSPAGTGTVDVTVTTASGTSPTSAADQFTFLPGSGVYTALPPHRVLDTRTNHTTLGPGGSVNLLIGGNGIVPMSATAVILNVTAVDESTAGFFTVYPTGAALPTASNLNWVTGETVPNLVSVGLGTGGNVSIFNGLGTADAVVDLEGYFAPTSTGGSAGQFVPLVPARITDTRAGSGQPNAGLKLVPGATLNVQVTGTGGIPAGGVTAVVLNATVTDTTTAGFLTVFPTGAPLPVASNLNWTAGVTVPNRVTVPVGAGGKVSFFNGLGSSDVIVDVNGYFTDSSGTGASFVPLTPARIVDTRNGTGAPKAPLGPGGTLVVQVADNGGVPAIAFVIPPRAVVLNVTVANTTAASDLVVWPHGAIQPLASDLNFVAGQTVPNLVVVQLSASGQVDIFNAFGSTHVIVDVVGWYG